MRYSSEDEPISRLVHDKTVELLTEVGFCVPDEKALALLVSAGCDVNLETQMVRLSEKNIEKALNTLPRNIQLYMQNGMMKWKTLSP